MVGYNTHKNKNQKGCGILDNFLKPFTYARYPNEQHAYSLVPATYGKPMEFMGPHTSTYSS